MKPREAALLEARLDVGTLLRRKPMTVGEIAVKMEVTPAQALKAVKAARAAGAAIVQTGERFALAQVAPAFAERKKLPVYTSRPDGSYVFGACGDNHLGSKYARLDVLEELYDLYAEEGVDRVFNTGNWIDGEARFNVHDLLVHGMDAQLEYLAEHYPRRPGIATYAVNGDDHEGWYGQKFGVNIGLRAAQTMREHGRTDWHDLGFMESHVILRHAKSGAEAVLAVVHPGGGSAYALSYSIQKIIESLDGGEKPAVGLYGHYHKLMAANIRNVWCVQTGTTEDQTPFMRKQKIAAHVGGTILELRQDPKTGVINRCKVELLRWFNRGFSAGRWSMSGPAHGVTKSLGAE